MTAISVSTVIFDGHPIETAFEELAALGANLVEPAYIHGYMDFDESAFGDGAARTARQRLASLGLSARAISAHIDLGGPDASAMLARRLRFAGSIGAQIVITNASSRAGLGALMQCLDKALPEAESAGVTIALENPGHGRDALIPDGAAGAALIARIGSKRLRLNYDCANVLTYSEGRVRPEDDFAAALPAMAHVHFKDVRRTSDGWAYAPLGEGEAALDLLAGKLRGLSIPVGLELPLRLSRRRGGDPERLGPPLVLPTIRAALRSSLDRARRWMGSSTTEG